jgi:gliding motility-associated-like protein
MTIFNCAISGFSLTGRQWNFGDPASGAANTSTLLNPVHYYSSPGTYTAQLILYYSCGGGTDTLKQVVHITQPCMTINSASITCASLGSATVQATGGIGPYSYTWMPTAQTSSVATGLNPGTYSIFIFDHGNNLTYTGTTVFTSLIPLTGIVNNVDSIACNGAGTGTAIVTNLAGGSGTENYYWSNGTSTLTAASPTSLSAGNWSVTITDALTGCQVYSVFTIAEPPPLALNLSANTGSVCVGGDIVLTGTASGGTPGYTYAWANGPPADTFTVNESSSATYSYVLTSTDANNCVVSDTISVDFIPNPVLSISDVSICPLQTGFLTVSGASSYLWQNNTTSNTFADNPLVTTSYSVIGSALGCTAAATASIILKPLPLALIINNSPRCEKGALQLTALGGSSAVWTGPLNFSSGVQNPVLNNLSLSQAGVYELTVTAANSCTASASTTVIIHPTPTLSATGATVCSSQTLNLSASSEPGALYQWSGPLNFTSNQQNPFLVSPAVNQTGVYFITATSAQGCSNTASVQVMVVPPPNLLTQLSSPSLCAQAFNGSANSITLNAQGASSYTLNTPGDISSNANPPWSITTVPPHQHTIAIATATLFGSNGVCTVSTTASFSVIPNPTVVVTPTPEICAGESFTYTNFGAASYAWSNSTPNFTTYNNGGVAVAHPSINSVFSVYGSSMGCNSASKTSTITVHPIPIVSITAQNPKVCIGSATRLTAAGTATEFFWQPFGTLDVYSGPEVNASPLLNQTYTVTGTANNCSNTAVVSISVLALPQPKANTSKTFYCPDETVTLSGQGGLEYYWKGPNNLSYSGEQVSFKAKAWYAGDFTLTVKDGNNCENSTLVPVHIRESPRGSLIGSRMQACVPFCSDFQYYSSAGGPDSIISTSWTVERKTFSAKTFSYCFSKPGEHVITGHFKDLNSSCVSTQTFAVTALNKPRADFTWQPENPIEGLQDVLFFNTSTGEAQQKFNWYFISNNTYRSQSENTTYFFREAGVFPVAYVVANTQGCVDTVVKHITITPDFHFYMPNTFTPNEDALNDLFMPVTRGIKNYTFMVFDRWGEKLFSSEDPLQGWDGSYRGQPCKQDVYGWKAVVSTVHGEQKVYSGNVTLLR